MTTQTQTAWTIDPAHSEVGFNVRHMMISKVSGKFNQFEVKAITGGDDFTAAQVDVNIAVDSISTGQNDRDNHLKSDDFFNAERFPSISFKSESYDGKVLMGELTIRDISKKVEMTAEFLGIAVDPYGQTKAGFAIHGEINRKEFNLNWNAVTEAGNIVVSDTVKLDINVQLIKQA